MKKTVIIFISMFTAIWANAQTVQDALLFSSHDHEGSARTMAMGNAFTALGGDLGGVSINPAGSAVAKYSQFTLTPALSISTNTTLGVSPYADGSLPYFERQMKSSKTGFGLPNSGLSFNWDTHRRSGLKNMSFGFIINRTASWGNDIYAQGTNSTTSFMGEMAYDATVNGYLGKELGSENAYDNMPWKPVTGYQSGMISTYGGHDDQFVGASEVIFDNGEIAVGGPLEQTFGSLETGSKYEYIFNVAANISDMIYIGANFGITSMEYNYDQYFIEQAVDPADFEIALDNGDKMYFNDMLYQYSYSANGTGYYAKLGAIVTPVSWLRIGAAIQTPTITDISEAWSEYGETRYDNSDYDAYVESPEGRNSYSMTSPFRANLGIALTLGSLGALSADYEYCDYGQMKYVATGTDRSYFESVNADIRDTMGAVHALRLGAEVKPLSGLAVRAGYGASNSAATYDDSLIHNLSFGLGYSSKGSFFTDFAIRRTFLGKEYFMPYADYIFNNDGSVNENAYAPEIENSRKLWKVLLTFGWRF